MVTRKQLDVNNNKKANVYPQDTSRGYTFQKYNLLSKKAVNDCFHAITVLALFITCVYSPS